MSDINMSKAQKELSAPSNAGSDPRPRCGLVMPISACDGCSEQHWSEVKAIITDAVDAIGFSVSLVSDADDVGIIQKRIIQNLYDNPIVVCDVSAKNPNVMFELGLRLAFDKPTIIVKDDKTTYSFDTAPIEHLEYPRDLRFSRIVEFKRNLGEKVKATANRAEKDPGYTTFLKHFGKFSVAKLETTEVSKDEFIMEELREMRRLLARRESVSERDRHVSMPDEIRRARLHAMIEDQVLRELAALPQDKPPSPDVAKNIYKLLLKQNDITSQFSGAGELREMVDAVLNRYLHP